MSRVELPDGAWAELRDPRKVSERLRRPCLEAATAMAGEKGAMEALQTADEAAAMRLATPEMLCKLGRLNDLVIVALVAEWSFDAEIDTDHLLDLPGDAYTQLLVATAPMVTELLPDMSPAGAVDDEGSKVETAPFGRSSGSRAGAPAAAL